MKTIIFLRHAKSSWAEPRMSDKERPLNPRGNRDAPIMAKKLKVLYPSISMALVSTSQRTRETIAYFKKEYGSHLEAIRFVDRLYHGMPDDYQTELYSLNDDVDTVLMVGHNPGMSYLANDNRNDAFIDNVPTSGIFVLKTNEDKWVNVHLSNCKRSIFIYPKMYV